MVEQFSVEAFIFIFILIIYVLTAHLIEVQKVPFSHLDPSSPRIRSCHHHGFPHSLIRTLRKPPIKQGMGNEIVFDNDIFFTIILPPIIFSAGYSLRKSLFFENFGMISFLGVIGTIIGFICLTLFCSLINSLFSNTLSLKEIMMLSSVLCATDTVAAMSLIKVITIPNSPISFLY